MVKGPGTALPAESWACTTTGAIVDPTVVVVGWVVNTSLLNAPRLTTMPDCVAVIAGVTVSVAVIDRVPGVFSVTLKFLVPLVSVEFPGRAAAGSLLVIFIVPEYAVAIFPNASKAVTVALP